MTESIMFPAASTKEIVYFATDSRNVKGFLCLTILTGIQVRYVLLWNR